MTSQKPTGYDAYERQALLGEGTFGRVYRAQTLAAGQDIDLSE